MKREEFLITSTEAHNVVKYKWNSARKEVQSLMQEYVNANGGRYILADSQAEKVGFNHVSGVMVYRCTETGKEISFSITKIA